ncbi:Gfo/Idh/MocA family protein [Microbacterium alcoholitolerans]|uniref:Gfo/Idh/MocA family protein n=1 Tax=unclassified Microbacterium TaxID=2609290 RepID=UPI003D16A28F
MTDTFVAGGATSALNAPLRIAVIGVGARAAIARFAVESGDGLIVAGVDPDDRARARVQSELAPEAATFATHDELLASGVPVDAAFVTSPDHTHAEITIDLLEAGVAVYLEKPLATSPADADAVLEAAARFGTPLYVGHNMRYLGVVQLMRDIIDRGEIGEVKAIWCRHFVGNGGDYYFKDWHADRSQSTGLLLQKGAHDIDVIHWLANGTTTDVVAMGDLSVYGAIQDRRSNADRRMPDWFSLDAWPPLAQKELNPVIDVEDISMMLMRLDNGVLASYQQCHFTPDYWRNYTVIGTEGRLENFGDTGGGVVRVWNSRTTYAPEGDLVYSIAGDAEGHSDGDALAVGDFVRFVRSRTSTQTSPVAARNAVAAAAAATESLRDGATPRKVAPPSPNIVDYFTPNQRKPSGPDLGPATHKEN